ncbi:hypothetical protein [Dryocola clanedunensis]|uniref:hypothetical protein n=1 Tax=Cedecea sulfonylureivorans TaxID=3051154 RepID=UPI001927D0E3|nr:hypothetical protein [Cedecea sulfonylureivorans]
MMRLIVVAMLLLTGTANAGSALVCKSKAAQPDHQGNISNLSNKTQFTCDEKVKGTIPELSTEGWRIVQVSQQEDAEKDEGIYQELIIEK